MSQQDHAERRRLIRFPIPLDAEIRFAGLDCTGFTADVSVAGAFVQAVSGDDAVVDGIQTGDTVDLRLSLGHGEQLCIRATVVHKEGSGLGLRFDEHQPTIFEPLPA